MLSTFGRYGRLFANFVAFSTAKSFEFRFDFYMRIIMDLIYYAVAIAFFRVLYLHTSTIGGWNEEQSMIFVAAYCLVDAIHMTLFSNNLWWLSTLVNRGDLDYYLVRPVSSLFFLSFREVAVTSSVNLLAALGILAWALARYQQPVSGAKLLLFGLFILNGSFLHYCLHILATIAVFWTHSPRGFGEVVWTLSRFADRPDRIYTGYVRRVLTLLLPFCLITSYPTRLLLERFDLKLLLHLLLVSFGFAILLAAVWSRALRNYSSASS